MQQKYYQLTEEDRKLLDAIDQEASNLRTKNTVGSPTAPLLLIIQKWLNGHKAVTSSITHTNDKNETTVFHNFEYVIIPRGLEQDSVNKVKNFFAKVIAFEQEQGIIEKKGFTDKVQSEKTQYSISAEDVEKLKTLSEKGKLPQEEGGIIQSILTRIKTFVKGQEK